jgi:hypothetical protein
MARSCPLVYSPSETTWKCLFFIHQSVVALAAILWQWLVLIKKWSSVRNRQMGNDYYFMVIIVFGDRLFRLDMRQLSYLSIPFNSANATISIG